MALVIVSEKRPDQALGFVLRRLGFVLLPLSVLFIKYYPDLGRQYHMGMPMFSGAALTKNALGQLCLIIATYLVWELLLKEHSLGERVHHGVAVVLAPMTLWLLYMADSVTSNVCLVLAISVLLLARLRAMRRRLGRLIGVGLGAAIAIGALETTFGIKDRIIVALGRRPDLTDRDEIWRIVLSMDTNPLIGVGYESFWTGQRALQIWEQLGVAGINQAHNGYIELYLNLGVIGLFLLAAGLLSGLVRTVSDSKGNYSYATLRLALIVADQVPPSIHRKWSTH
jgi:O-antigen ligase